MAPVSSIWQNLGALPVRPRLPRLGLPSPRPGPGLPPPGCASSWQHCPAAVLALGPRGHAPPRPRPGPWAPAQENLLEGPPCCLVRRPRHPWAQAHVGRGWAGIACVGGQLPTSPGPALTWDWTPPTGRDSSNLLPSVDLGRRGGRRGSGPAWPDRVPRPLGRRGHRSNVLPATPEPSASSPCR